MVVPSGLGSRGTLSGSGLVSGLGSRDTLSGSGSVSGLGSRGTLSGSGLVSGDPWGQPSSCSPFPPPFCSGFLNRPLLFFFYPSSLRLVSLPAPT